MTEGTYRVILVETDECRSWSQGRCDYGANDSSCQCGSLEKFHDGLCVDVSVEAIGFDEGCWGWGRLCCSMGIGMRMDVAVGVANGLPIYILDSS